MEGRIVIPDGDAGDGLRRLAHVERYAVGQCGIGRLHIVAANPGRRIDDDADFRAVFELRDKNGDTVINEPLR
jgi:hypothetical protein